MLTRPCIIASILAVPLFQAQAYAQNCHGMQASAVAVDTGSDLLPQRCDDPGKCRIFDMSGKPIGKVGDFLLPGTSSEGLQGLRLKETDLQGYMDGSGKVVIEPIFKRVGPFCEGRAAVQRADGRYAYIGRDGQEIGDSYDGAESFTEGRGLVSIYKGGDTWLHGFVDVTGKLVIPASFAGARLFSEGRAAVKGDNGKWGYIDHDGKLVIEPRFAEAGPFLLGRAIIRMSDAWAKNSGLIDESGKLVIEARYETIEKVGGADFWGAGGVDPTWRGRGEPPLLSKLFDRSGRAVSASQFNSFGGASEGMIDVCRSNKCGFMDAQGKAAILLRFAYVNAFEEGLAAVSPKGDKYGFIDRSGKFVIEPRYDGIGPDKGSFAAGPFGDGIAPAGCQGRWGFIDKQGAWVVPPLYRLAQGIANGFAEVKIKAGSGHIRRDGTPIDFDLSETDQVNPPARPCGAELKKAAAN